MRSVHPFFLHPHQILTHESFKEHNTSAAQIYSLEQLYTLIYTAVHSGVLKCRGLYMFTASTLRLAFEQGDGAEVESALNERK